MCIIQNQLIRNFKSATKSEVKSSLGKTAKDLLPEIEYNEFKKITGYIEPEQQETKALHTHVC
jgi:hypothetical protein